MKNVMASRTKGAARLSPLTLGGYGLIGIFSMAAIVPVLAILTFIIYKGAGQISWEFLFTSSPDLESGGILIPIIGTLFITVLTLLIAVPLGVGAGIYLSEYARPGWTERLVRHAVLNLAGIPSVVYGLFGYGIFVLFLKIGVSILAGSLTLAVLVLPLIVSVTYQSLHAVPVNMREASLALGASRWQTVRSVVIPAGMPGVLTGIILSTARIAGETAPVLFTVAAFFPYVPVSVYEKAMPLSYHLFMVSTQATGVSDDQKYGITLVLVSLVLLLNTLSIIVRTRLRNKMGRFG